MTKYKVGDYVKIVKPDEYIADFWDDDPTGEIVRIIKITEEFYKYEVKFFRELKCPSSYRDDELSSATIEEAMEQAI